MHNLFVSYDLMTPGKDYTHVQNAIKALGLWAKVHFSLYYVRSNLDATEACNQLIQSIDVNDKVIVIDAAFAAWNELPDAVTKQIQSHWGS